MGVVMLTIVLVVLVLMLLAFQRGGAREPVSVGAGEIALSGVPIATALERAERLIAALGLELVRRDPDDADGATLIARTRTEELEQTVFVRAFDRFEPVRAPDVIAAIDFARGEGFHQAMLVSPSGFSDEARLAAEGTIAVLIDDAELERTVTAQ